jgi:hypothetical protein
MICLLFYVCFRYLNEIGDHFLRKSNESLQLFGCDISYNTEEAIFVHSPFWDVHHSNISEITIMINNSLITDNGRGILQFSRYVFFLKFYVLKILKEKNHMKMNDIIAKMYNKELHNFSYQIKGGGLD